MKIFFETYGCRLNRAEALQQEAALLARGHTLVTTHAEADAIILRGCSVTARAQAECERMINHLKGKYPKTEVVVCGCLPEAEKNAIHPLLKISNDDNGDEATPTRTARAYLKVQDGCNSSCTFCIVPKYRGKSKSVPVSELLDRARRFIAAGYREIVITGCNLTQYSDSGHTLPELITELASLDRNVRLRLGSIEPGPVAEKLIPVITENPNVCRFLHLSVQSGSQKILSAMRRPYSAKDVDNIVKVAREAVPDIAIGCDIISGFPSENEIDFHATFGQLKRLGFSNVHIFPYSERPGTPAAIMPGAIGKDVRRRRALLMSEKMHKIRKEYAMHFIGKTVEVLVERNGRPEGWTSEYLWCKIIGNAARKSIVKVFVTDVKSDVLYGRIV